MATVLVSAWRRRCVRFRAEAISEYAHENCERNEGRGHSGKNADAGSPLLVQPFGAAAAEVRLRRWWNRMRNLPAEASRGTEEDAGTEIAKVGFGSGPIPDRAAGGQPGVEFSGSSARGSHALLYGASLWP